MRQPRADVPRITGLSSQTEVARHHNREPELIAIREDSALKGRERFIQGGVKGARTRTASSGRSGWSDA
jgi:hypothetical protein